jgi:hypothetical protein
MSFTVAGVSTQHGITKVRFANDLTSRVKLLSKGGHSPLELIELPNAMSKADACQYLLNTGGVFEQWTDLITETMGKKSGTVAKTTTTKAVKAKPTAQAKTAKNLNGFAKKKAMAKDKQDFEIEEIKEIAEATV